MTRAEQETAALEQEQAAFFERSYTQLFRMAYAWCRDRELALDLVQETFVKIFRNWPRHRVSVGNLEAYAARTLRNCLTDEFKRRSSRAREVLSGTDEQSFPPAPEGGNDEVPDLAVRAAIMRLPEKLRDVVQHVYYEGLSLAETAVIMGIGPRTAHNYHSMAKKRLESDLSNLVTRAEGKMDDR